MADITSRETRKPGVIAGVKKLSTRVDLTPMVDLGFLLITFFIFTTAMSQPTTMKLIMPDDEYNATPTKESGALTLMPAADGQVFYYEGIFQPDAVHVTSMMEVRNLIIAKKSRTPLTNLVVVIKPSMTSVYRDIVNVLDEMTINDVKRYAIVDITREEEILVSESLLKPSF